MLSGSLQSGSGEGGEEPEPAAGHGFDPEEDEDRAYELYQKLQETERRLKLAGQMMESALQNLPVDSKTVSEVKRDLMADQGEWRLGSVHRDTDGSALPSRGYYRKRATKTHGMTDFDPVGGKWECSASEFRCKLCFAKVRSIYSTYVHIW